MFNYQFSSLSSSQLDIIKAANKADSTILITGYSGTGKSHLAHVIHKTTGRAANKFQKINLASLSENLIESELFGHEKGAFTGADSRRVGKLELCNGGTVFLDEIGELPMRLQTKLLDFIQYKKITPVGSNREIELNVRIIAATNIDMHQAVKNKTFREDLFHRINVFSVQMSGLKDIKESIAPLASRFVDQWNELIGKKILGISENTKKIFLEYEWPGNIRELQNVIEYAVAMEEEKWITPQSLPAQFNELKLKYDLCNKNENELIVPIESKPIEIQSEEESNQDGFIKIPIHLNYHECKDVYEKAYLLNALKVCKGQINLTSRTIGLNKVSLIEKIKKLNIDWKSIRSEYVEEQPYDELITA